MALSAGGVYRISSEVFERFPAARVGVGIARITIEKKPVDKVAQQHLSDRKQGIVRRLIEKEITVENYRETAACTSWRRVLATFDAGDDKICTIEKMYGRAASEADKIRVDQAAGKKPKRADLGHVSNVVDLCNCIAMETDTPMGVLARNAIRGESITLRYGVEGETFIPLGAKVTHSITPSQIVLSDGHTVLSWLWTYMVGDSCCVPRESPAGEKTEIIVCADQAEDGVGDAEAAVRSFIEGIEKLGGEGRFVGVVSQAAPELVIPASI